MTPASIIAALLGAARMALVFAPKAPRVLTDIIDELDELPALVTELGDGTWTAEDVDALDEALTEILERVPDLDARSCRRIARGLSSVIDVIVSQVRKQPTASKRGERPGDVIRRARSKAVANRMPDAAGRGVGW